ncbi:hypothetical protein BPOR_0286g00090 [Botrytis porri]|uniref:Uncharacterized protein n=1 Tax=Botrytis porri TaxID=87229 RepID=A0A4Z1KSZ0_9HELO|nr:hypothetical protein BPOR_0286g00090 [Botrytis porri]
MGAQARVSVSELSKQVKIEKRSMIEVSEQQEEKATIKINPIPKVMWPSQRLGEKGSAGQGDNKAPLKVMFSSNDNKDRTAKP